MGRVLAFLGRYGTQSLFLGVFIGVVLSSGVNAWLLNLLVLASGAYLRVAESMERGGDLNALLLAQHVVGGVSVEGWGAAQDLEESDPEGVEI